MTSSTLALLTLLAVADGAAPASDEEIEQQAMALFEKGEAAYAAGKFADALVAFNGAYEKVPVPGLLFNIGQTHRKLGHHEDAARFLQRYLDEETELVPNREEIAAIVFEEIELAEAERKTGKKQGPSASSQTATPPAPPPASPFGAILGEPVFWGVAAGAAALAVVGGIVVAVAAAPPPAGTLGTFDLRDR